MKRYILTLLGVTCFSYGQVEIPGVSPIPSNEPQYNEASGVVQRAALRQPYTGGNIVPAWAHAELLEEDGELSLPMPEFVPGYYRMSLTGRGAVEQGEFYTTIIGDSPSFDPIHDPYADPYGGMDPSMYTPDGFEANQDPYSDPYGGMDPSMYTDPTVTPNDDPYSDPYGGMDPSMYMNSSTPNQDPYSDPYGGMDPSMYTDPSFDSNEDPFTSPY